MKKRYLVLVLIIGFAVVFWALLRDASAPVVIQPLPQPTLAPEAPPAQKGDLIIVESPRPQAQVASPLVIKGKARGNWYFEGSFPITLTNWDGLIIAEGYATAQGEWMTTEYVPFTASIEYTLPPETPYRRGFLILEKNNASGESQFDDSLEIPINL
jgi:hypothetical protein